MSDWYKTAAEVQAEKAVRELEESRKVIQTRLNKIDQESARPFRAILAGKETEFDHQKLAALEAEAEKLRAQLKELI